MISSLLSFSLFLSIMLVCFGSIVSKLNCLLGCLVVYMLSVRIWKEVMEIGRFSEEVLGIVYYVDSISVYFVMLTAFLLVICVVNNWNRKDNSLYNGLLVLISLIVFCVFLVEHVIYFYMFFECVLIPMYIFIGMYGSRSRKVKAGYYLFIYTLFGSVLMLVGIMLVYNNSYSLSYSSIVLSKEIERIVWLLFFVGFMVKVPMFPFHLWLAEAHVEASTEGSVVLAGILLKLGTYGMLRFNVEMMKDSCMFYKPLVIALGCIGIIYTSLTCLRQTDIKRIIAYGSVGHMAMVVLGMVVGTKEGYVGSIVQMLGHGIVSAGLFICIGSLYGRLGSRNIYYIQGTGQVMPIFSIVFLLMVLGNIGFPLTSGFIGEYLLLKGVCLTNMFVGLLVGIGMFLTGCYSLYMFNRICYGNVSNRTVVLKDLGKREVSVVLMLVVVMLVIGIYPGIVVSNV